MVLGYPLCPQVLLGDAIGPNLCPQGLDLDSFGVPLVPSKASCGFSGTHFSPFGPDLGLFGIGKLAICRIRWNLCFLGRKGYLATWFLPYKIKVCFITFLCHFGAFFGFPEPPGEAGGTRLSQFWASKKCLKKTNAKQQSKRLSKDVR